MLSARSFVFSADWRITPGTDVLSITGMSIGPISRSQRWACMRCALSLGNQSCLKPQSDASEKSEDDSSEESSTSRSKNYWLSGNILHVPDRDVFCLVWRDCGCLPSLLVWHFQNESFPFYFRRTAILPLNRGPLRITCLEVLSFLSQGPQNSGHEARKLTPPRRKYCACIVLSCPSSTLAIM